MKWARMTAFAVAIVAPRGGRIAMVALACTVSVVGARAQSVDPFIAASTSDPSELARVVDRVGDDGVIARLGDDTPVAVRLAAIRATPQLEGPERAIEPLAAIAAGRDPDLAPAAAMSLVAIARALDPQALDAREVLREELTPAHTTLTRLASDETARGDLRRAADLAVAALDAIGVPPAAE